MAEYNLKYKKESKTQYSKASLLAQYVPSLEMTYALRILYGIEGGIGQIFNADESMTFRWDTSSKSWTI